MEETSVSRSIIYQAGETANLPCDISFPNNQKDELMLIMWYREDVRSPIYSIGKFLYIFDTRGRCTVNEKQYYFT